MKYPEVEALNTPPKKLVVFLHGVGSDGDDLIALAPYMQKDLPDCHFISPHGIDPYDMAPFGRQWFSLQDRSEIVLKNLLEESSGKLAQVIRDKQKQLKLNNANTILIGFSQGTMLGLYLTLTSEEPFFAMVGFSGALIKPDICINKTTPICLIHGTEDDVINISALDDAGAYLTEQKIDHKIYKIPNLRHSIDNKSIASAINFINEV
jgi:phospholipase/carboxylesterase